MSSRLFIELYMDEDVSVLVAELIRARGFSVVTTVESGNLGRSDEAQLDFASSTERAILTHNRVHFEKLATRFFEDRREHFGIIIASRQFPNEISRRLLTVLNSTTADEMKNQIRYI